MYREIGERYGRTAVWVVDLLKAFGVPMRGRGRPAGFTSGKGGGK